MNKTKVTTRKGSKSKSKKGSPEVFVLPPNLLEKLGIHLENYGSVPESTVGSQVTDSKLISIGNEPSINKLTSNKDTDSHVTTSSEIKSSIIETAELMKKSVFLSPTFISNNTSVIQGEIEIVGNAKTESTEVTAGLINNDYSAIKAEELSTVETSSSNTTSLSIENGIQHVQMQQTLLDEHADEAYSSDCSNSNMGTTANSELKSNPNKINILSEQIILPSQYYKLKSNYSTKGNSLIHVSMKTKINSQNNMQNSNKQNDLDLNPKIAGNIVPTDITIVHKGDMSEQNFVVGDFNLSMEDNESINQNDSDFNPKIAGYIVPSSIIIASKGDMSEQHFVEADSNLSMEENENIHQNDVDLNQKITGNIVPTAITIASKGEMSGQPFVEEGSTLSMLENESIHQNDLNPKIARNIVSTAITIVSKGDMSEQPFVEEDSNLSMEDNESIHQSDLDLNLNITDNIVPAEITIVSEGDMNEQHFVEGDSNLAMEVNETLQSIEKIDFCAVLNETESEFIIATQQENYQPDLEVVLPRLMDVDNESNKRTEGFSTNTQIYSEKSDNAAQRTSDLHNKDSCIGETKIRNITSEILTKERKFDFMERNNKEHVMSVENESVNTSGNRYSPIGVNLQTEQNESMAPQEQNSETYSINHEQSHSIIDSEKFNLSVLENPSQCVPHSQCRSGSNSNVNKAKCSSDVLLVKQNKDNPAQKTCPSPIFYVKRHNQRVLENSEHDEILVTKKMKFEKSEHHEIKNSDTDSLENNKLKKGNVNKASVIQEDKVREIAKYLSEFADMKKRNHFINRHTMSRNKTLSNKKGTIYSKSSIQGVEKPGGSEINKRDKHYPPAKTYGRKGIQRPKNVACYTIKESKSNTTQSIINAHNSSSKRNCYDMEMDECLCYDFGRLKSYDDISSYEHIHFWNNAKTDCTPEIMFSIYNEDASAVTIDSEALNDVEVYPSETSYVPLYKLCWNELKHNSFDVCNLKEEAEIVTNDLITSEKKISECADSENVEKQECNEKQEAEKEVVSSQRNKMVYVNSLQKCEGTTSNNIVSDEHSAKSGQKRKRSIALGDDGVPPAKNSKRRTSKRFSHTNEGQADIDEQAITTSVKENSSEFTPSVESGNLSIENEEPVIVNGLVKCAVCEESIEDHDWNGHRASRHDYLSWKFGEPPLDVNNEAAVREHLYDIAKACGGLTCAKCGLTRKYVKAYLSHVRSCTGLSESQNDSACDASLEASPEVESADLTGNVVGEKDVASANTGSIKCGVCQESVEIQVWSHHIASRHDYLAWKLGDAPLDVADEAAIKNHLNEISKTFGGLKCAKCGATRKYVKAYLSHIKSCDGLNESQTDSACNVSSDETNLSALVNCDLSNTEIVNEEAATSTGLVKCAVCDESVQEKDWNSHIASRHDYLAWKLGDTALDVNDEAAVRDHLYAISKTFGGLSCAKCGLTRKYVKAYLSHIKSCDGLNESQTDSAYNVSSDETKLSALVNGDLSKTEIVKEEAVTSTALVKCAVCEESVQDKDWNIHIAARHDYLAWKLGDIALDVADEAAIKNHLNEISKTFGGLKCAKCGATRKYVKAYLSHIKSCDGLNESQTDSACNVSSDETNLSALVNGDLSNTEIVNEEAVTSIGLVKCAVCEESVQDKDWNTHIAARHDYLAWKLGDTALDVTDEAAIKNHLNEISKTFGGLKCAKCGATRKYVKAYLSHIKSCDGLNESQTDSACNVSSDERNLSALVNGYLSNTEIVKEEAVTSTALVKCAVCEESVQEKDWNSHIAARHDYLAWKLGDTALNINDESAVRVHLYEITKACGGLTCVKCGLVRKYVNSYLSHFRKCNGLSQSQNDISMATEGSGVDVSEFVKCAVCAEHVLVPEWNSHIASRHDYMAWKDGESLDLEDEKAVRQHLRQIKRQNGGLTCAKCDINMTCVKSYLSHVKSCKKTLTLSDLEDCSQNLVLETRASTNEGRILTTSEMESTLVKCGVCGQYSANNDWLEHIAASHGYLAWKHGEPPLDLNDEKKVRVHLLNIAKKVHVFICPKCDEPHKTVKGYLHHIRTCGETQEDMNSSFKCGACNEIVVSLLWEKHLSEKHDYLAWKDGDTPLSVDDEEDVHEHLYNFSKEFGGLICNKCGLRRKYVKSYLEHIKTCQHGVKTEAAPEETLDDLAVDFTSGGTCAVCHKEIEANKWIQHTQREHNYLAWREGEKPWNVDDFHDLNQYLYVICKRMEGLTCNKCGIVRKYVKTYLTHIKNCDVTDFTLDASVAEGVGPLNKDVIQCAMCKEQMKRSDWKNHAMKKHYNVTWIIGETPIDIKNPYAVERYLKEYKQEYGSLKCNVCNASRASFAGFYAHIIVCGKTEEEIDVFKSVCDICNNKYLCIYKNQHAMIHRVQEYTAELKVKKIENNLKLNTAPNVSGKRRAAVKARSVIENYSDNMSKYAHSCQSCGFGTDFEDELKTHKCEVSNEKDFSGDESSAAEIGSSDDESGDTDVDSNVSNEVNDNEMEDDDDDDDEDGVLTKKKVRHREPAPVLAKVSRIPYKVDDPNSYIHQGDLDFCDTFLTDEVLFPQWQCQFEAVPESEMTRYLPPLNQSCKVNFDSGWKTLKQFEAKKNDKGSCIFVGASIACIAWAPFRVEDIRDGSAHYLAVACHNGPDCPRYQGDETPKHENLIQIWNYSKFERLPQIVLGIAHDFGTVWSMDWCPSGARDSLKHAKEGTRRLGLLAVACSSGSAYIFAVPFLPTEVENNQFILKIKPVAELRMTMGSERKRYQATSVSWSKQKGHTLLLVGYADGSTAYYDLHSTSPLLFLIENDVHVFYPYNDERPHNTCITGTDLYPVRGDAVGCGVGVCTAPTGAELAARAGAGAPGRARLPTASLAVAFAPHACCAVLGGDDAIMHTAISELAWVPPGRRLGGIRTVAGCTRCGRVVVSTPPVLRFMRLHPAYCDAKKQVVGLLEMTHLSKKRKKQVNDELAMILEPLTYDDAINKYGITFRVISRNEKAMQNEWSAKPKAHCPERFPLADVTSMAFCPSRRYHEKLALATHSGILFLAAMH